VGGWTPHAASSRLGLRRRRCGTAGRAPCRGQGWGRRSCRAAGGTPCPAPPGRIWGRRPCVHAGTQHACTGVRPAHQHSHTSSEYARIRTNMQSRHAEQDGTLRGTRRARKEGIKGQRLGWDGNWEGKWLGTGFPGRQDERFGRGKMARTQVPGRGRERQKHEVTRCIQ